MLDLQSFGKAIFGYDTSGETHSPDTGNMSAFDLDFTEDIGSPINPDVPAVETYPDNIGALLKQIEINTRKPPEPHVYEQYIWTFPASMAGEQSFSAHEDHKYIFITRTPRAISVYAGIGRTLYLGALAIGQAMSAKLPFPTRGITIEWASTANANEQIAIIFSSERLEVDII